MKEGGRLFRLSQERLQLFLTTLQDDHLLIETIGSAALQDEVQERIEFPVYPFDLGFGRIDRGSALHAEPVHLAGELVAELLEQLGVHQVMAQRVEDARLKLIAPDVFAIVAGALVAGRRAADQISRDHRVTAAATAALSQAREEVFGAPAFPEVVLGLAVVATVLFDGLLPLLHGLPEIVVEDA
ncbi:hypothetical protein QU41_19750 [Bradyrhizobium elkanii]|nr:hypothetical protein QU41_19750 [Bradyrhizobium elkanii]